MNDTYHDNEIPIDDTLVRELLAAQFPRLAALPLNRLRASGSSNVLFRLGEDLLLRFPRQPGGGASIAKECRWLPTIGPHLPVAVPEIVALGEPAFGYSEPWAIVRRLDGDLPATCGPDDAPDPARATLAVDLADVIQAFRAADVPDSAASDRALRWYRGRSLAEFNTQTRRYIELCRSIPNLGLDLDAALAVWEDALALPGAEEVGPDRWYHGDLVAENLLVRDGRLSAVLDFGGLGVGDPTIDLHGAWELFDRPARDVFRAQLAVDDAEWFRARAWALAIALGALSYYWTTMSGRRSDRLTMARSVLAEAATDRDGR